MNRTPIALIMGLLLLGAAVLSGCEGDAEQQAVEVPGGSLGGTNEGSVTSPVLVSLGNPHAGGVGSGGASYYHFFSGQFLIKNTIGLNNNARNLAWTVYSDSGFSSPVAICDVGGMAAPDVCYTNAILSGSQYYLKVTEATGQPDTFTLFLQPGQFGLMPNTVANGAVGQFSEDDYTLPASIGNKYVSVLMNLSQDADLYLYGTDPTIVGGSGILCDIQDNTAYTLSAPEDCTFTATPGVNFTYHGVYGVDAGSTAYNLAVFPAPAIGSPTSEGTIGTPIGLTRGAPRAGQVFTAGSSSYYAVGLTGGSVNVVLAGMRPGSDLDLYLWSNPAFTTTQGCSVNWTQLTGQVPEECRITTPGSTLYIEVYNFSGGASDYQLLVY